MSGYRHKTAAGVVDPLFYSCLTAIAIAAVSIRAMTIGRVIMSVPMPVIWIVVPISVCIVSVTVISVNISRQVSIVVE